MARSSNRPWRTESEIEPKFPPPLEDADDYDGSDPDDGSDEEQDDTPLGPPPGQGETAGASASIPIPIDAYSGEEGST